MDDNYLELEENLEISDSKNKWISFYSEHIFNIIKKIIDNNISEIDDAIYEYATEQISDQYNPDDLHRPDKMQIIDELEGEERGPYAGAVGYFSYNGCCDFAIAIRSIFIENNKGFVQSGAGIVSDSVSENEFKETEHKAGAMLQALREASD